MKDKFLLSIFLVIVLSAWQCRPVNNKVPCILLIDHPSFFHYPTGHGDTVTEFAAEVILYNKSNDTLLFTGQWAPDSKFYYTENENMVVIDNAFSEGPSVKPDTIPPNHCRAKLIFFRFKKVPDTTFAFKIGMHLLKWQNSYRSYKPDLKTIEQSGILWSDMEIFKTNRRHDTYDKKPEEYKREHEKIFDALTNTDRINNNLTIDERSIKVIKDTITSYFDSVAFRNHSGAYYNYKRKRFGFIRIPIKFENKSNTTLEYVSWSCSWSEMYKTDNKNVMILEDSPCFGNYPIISSILPHKSTTRSIGLLFDQNAHGRYYKFRIGLTLLKSGISHLQGFADALPLFESDPRYTIWSNQIEIPKP